ncbi:MAG: ABC transporter permease [Terracidiphilus sp.]|jgi:predicted permease
MAQNLNEFVLRLKALFQKRRMEREMADELAFHQAMLQDKLLRQGVAMADVDAATRRKFGSTSRWHERLRELWQFKSLENFWRDVKFAARLLRGTPGFTVVAILTLALGVGANTTVFSIINGLLLRPLDVPASDRLAVIGISQGNPNINYSFSEPLFRSLERRPGLLEQVFAESYSKLQVRNGSGSESVPGALVSGGFFPALETAPLLGRALGPEDDRKGGDPAGYGVVISEGFWQRWFNRAPNVIGQKLAINHVAFTVVGVMPKRFIGVDPLARPELFVAMATEPALNGVRSMTMAGFHASWMNVMGRMRPGATLAQVDAQVASESGAVLHEAIPDAQWIAGREKQHFHFVAESGAGGFTYLRLMFRKPLTVVFAMCGGILLLACMNLASLLMARGAARQRELATRLAMGATRRRLVQQLLVESLLVAAMGTAAGLAISPLVSKFLSVLLLGSMEEVHVDTSLDIRVFAFAALASIVATLLVGLVPALQATSGSLNEHIKSGQHTTQAHERQRILPKIMMGGEVGLALMLVVGAGLLASSLVKLYRSGAGFDPRGVQNISFAMEQQPLKGDALAQFYRQLGDGLSHQPGVTDVSFARIVPFTHYVWDQSYSAAGGKEQEIYRNEIGPDYFKTMRIPLFTGRDFTWNDTKSSGLKLILNQSAAKLLFPDRSPLGQTITNKDDKTTLQYEVIGVVGDAKYEELRSPAPPTAYSTLTQNDGEESRSYNLVVRTKGVAGPLANTARMIGTKLDPGIPAPVMTSMESVIDDSLSAERTMALLAVFFAVCALVVTAVGLYGTLAYATARRTSEIGIRMALGAKRSQVVTMIFLQNATVAATGTALGVGGALLASRALASFLYGTSTRDPWVFAGSVFALAMIASAASLLPALRSARIDPMTAIRCE